MSKVLAASPWRPSQKFLVQISRFFKHHPPDSVSRHLRCILLDYMRAHLDSGLPLDFEHWLEEFSALFDLLDSVAEEVHG